VRLQRLEALWHELRAAVAGYRAAGIPQELAHARDVLSSAGLRVDCEAQEDVRLAPAHESVLALAIREAVTNVVRHARASAVRLRLAGAGGACRFEIQDDGVVSKPELWVHSDIPTATVEPAYLTNPRERSLLLQNDFRDAIALGIFQGMLAADPQIDVELIPVAVYWGRAPQRERSWFRLLLVEDWALTTRARKPRSWLSTFGSPRVVATMHSHAGKRSMRVETTSTIVGRWTRARASSRASMSR